MCVSVSHGDVNQHSKLGGGGGGGGERRRLCCLCICLN